MADIASRDGNRVTTLLGVDSSQFSIPTKVAVDPITHAMLVENTASTAVIGQVEITDNTNTANILKSDGTAAGQNALIVAGAYKEASFTTTSAQAVASGDVSNYKWISVHITGQGTNSVVNFQGSNDNTNWVAISLINASATGSSGGQTSSSTTGLFSGPSNFRYFRLNVTGISAGTTAGVLELYTVPPPQNVLAVMASAGTATSTAVPDNAFYIAGVNSGNLTALTLDSSGNVLFTGGTSGTSGDAKTPSFLNQIMNINTLSNGTSWDRQRNNFNTTTGDTPTITTATTTNGATQTNYNARGAIVTAILGTVSGVSPALALQLQWSPDGGTTWLTYGAAGTALAVATGNTVGLICYPTALPTNLLGTTTTADDPEINAPLPRTWRVTYISSGTITSIAVASVQVNYIL